MGDKSGRSGFFTALIAEHPTLTRAAFLCPLTLGAVTLKDSLLLGIAGGILLVLTPAAGYALRGIGSAALRLALGLLCAAVVLCGAAAGFELVSPGTIKDIALAWPLLAPDAVRLAYREEGIHKLPDALGRGAREAAGFAALAVPLGAVREALGQGTIFDCALPMKSTVYAVTLPAFVLIAAGVLAAMAQALRLREAERAAASASPEDIRANTPDSPGGAPQRGGAGTPEAAGAPDAGSADAFGGGQLQIAAGAERSPESAEKFPNADLPQIPTETEGGR